MDSFDYSDQPSHRSRPALAIWDILSIFGLLMTLCLVGYFVLLFANPYTALNPFPPPPPLVLLSLPTATITPLGLVPTWTPSPTIQPTPSDTPRPTFTPIPTDTPFSLFPPTKTPTPSLTPKPTGLPFDVTVTAIDSTIIHPEAGCNWFGVGGEAYDRNNAPILYLRVRLGGTLNGQIIDPNMHTTVTGIAPEYGRAGFEFMLGTVPVASNSTLWIELLDEAGLPLSEKVYFSTYADCSKNLILIRFKKVR